MGVITVVDKPNDSTNILLFAGTFIVLTVGALYGLHYISGGGAGITELCNSYLKPVGEEQAKLTDVLYQSVHKGYTSKYHVDKVTMPLIKNLVTHFMNNVNGLGSFHDVTIEFVGKMKLLENKRVVSSTLECKFSASTPEEFLETFINYSEAFKHDEVKSLKRVRIHRLRKLVACMNILSGGGQNPMAAMMGQLKEGEPKQQDPYADEAKIMTTMSGFEQQKFLKDLMDPDFYAFYPGSSPANGEKIKQLWAYCFQGEGHGMQASQYLGQFAKFAGGLVEHLQKDLKSIGEEENVSLLPFIKPETVSMTISRGLLGSTTEYLWANGKSVSHGETAVVAEPEPVAEE